MRHDFGDGKFTVIFHNHGEMEALRYGEPWRDLTGDGMVYAMLAAYDEQRKRLVRALFLLNLAESFIAGFVGDEVQDEPVDDLHEAIETLLSAGPHLPEMDNEKLNKD